MNPQRLGALLEKEWREMFKNKMVLISVAIAPMILLLISVFLLVLFEASYGELLADAQLLRQLEGDWAILFNNILMFFLFMPLVIPLAIAVYAVVGEKEQGSLEPLLATPITDLELFAGKALASVLPGLLITWAAYAAFAAVALAWMPPALTAFFFAPPWLLAMFGLAPLIALFSVLAAMAISAFTRDTRAAYQLSSLIMVPFLIGSLYHIFTQRELVSVGLIAAAMGGAALVDALVLGLGLRLFRREDILTRCP